MSKLLLSLIPLFTFIKAASYTLQDSYAGNTFFNGFDFVSWSNGCGDAVDETTARNLGLINTTNSQVYIGVEHTKKYTGQSKCRPTVQIQTKKQYNNGLFLVQAKHMPYGCGIWPAFWLMGPNWPYNGEIDVVENINLATDDQATLHTSNGCDFKSVSNEIKANITGYLASTNCSFQPGCSIEASDSKAYGKGFDESGGGLWAVEVNDGLGIRMWHFVYNEIPNDIKTKKPDPNTWGKPFAYYPFGNWCPSNKFQKLMVLFDIYLCGWSGNTGGNYPYGWSQQCSQYGNNCETFVENNPQQFVEAYWLIDYLDVYVLS